MKAVKEARCRRSGMASHVALETLKPLKPQLQGCESFSSSTISPFHPLLVVRLGRLGRLGPIARPRPSSQVPCAPGPKLHELCFSQPACVKALRGACLVTKVTGATRHSIRVSREPAPKQLDLSELDVALCITYPNQRSSSELKAICRLKSMPLELL